MIVKKCFQYILFDLDGTLTDPKEGICKSVQFALHQMGIVEPDIDRLEPFIGPPLADSFKEFYHMTEEEAEKAIGYYRERFSVIGLYENKVYDGVPQMLKHLKQAGSYLAVASSKPEVFVRRILKHFRLEEYFDVVVGSELDGRRTKKEEVVSEALIQLYALKDKDYMSHREWLKDKKSADLRSQTAMVGDRIFDMNGAKEYGLCGVAAAYGYAPKKELENSGADYIAVNVRVLEAYLSGKDADSIQKQEFSGKIPENSFFRAVYMIAPFAVYYLAVEFVTYAGLKLVEAAGGYKGLSISIAEHSSTIAAAIKMTAVLCGGAVLFFLFHQREPIPRKKAAVNHYLTAALTGALLAMGLNILISYFYRLLEGSGELYQKASFNAAIPFGLAVLFYVLISPAAEELLFRWLLYGRIRRIMGAPLAIVLTALFFGFYHGNLLQGIYAILMGIVLAELICWSENLLLPFLFHMTANAAVYFTGAAPEKLRSLLTAPISGAVFITAGLGMLLYLHRGLNHRKTQKSY